MRRTLALAVCVLAIAVGGGCYKKKKNKGAAGGSDPAAAAPARRNVKEYVTITVDGKGFHPDKIQAEQGQPITLTFHRDTEKTCATAVVFASENIKKDLPVDQDVKIALIPGKNNIRFSCPMNMFSGELDVQ